MTQSLRPAKEGTSPYKEQDVQVFRYRLLLAATAVAVAAIAIASAGAGGHNADEVLFLPCDEPTLERQLLHLVECLANALDLRPAGCWAPFTYK